MFYIGQKVVRLIDGVFTKKGDVVTVTNLAECPKCGELHISTDRLHGHIGLIQSDCADCGTDIKVLHSEFTMGVARNFAPLESYLESFSIAMELVQEMDQVDKQKVFNPKKIEA